MAARDHPSPSGPAAGDGAVETLTRSDAVVRLRRWGEGPLLVALHGFSHDSSTWAGLAVALAGRAVTAPDLRGHGRTRVAEGGRFDLESCADDVAALLAKGRVSRCDLVGYSMGARVAMHVALSRPEIVRSLCLVGGNPGIEDPAQRRRRAEQDAAAARRILDGGLDSFMTEWERMPLFTGLLSRPPAEQAALAAVRRSHDPAQLAASLEGMSVGRQADLWSELPSLPMPVLAVAGEHDAKFAALAERIRAEVPTAASAIVAGCGHSVHLEAPEAFAGLLAAWLP